jgi:SAM-dependent methyltransferase
MVKNFKKLFQNGVLGIFNPTKNAKKSVPKLGRIDFGDFFTTKPFSKEFGYDRGGPVDRYYIENFLLEESPCIKGTVLEIGDNEYTMKFGGEKVIKSDILHVHADNPKATFVGDLADAPNLPDNHFDCIVLTQTLHLIYDFKAALKTCHRVLKPGGVLLLTVPGITHIDRGEWRETWFWAFTQKSMSKLISETFPKGKAEIKALGNVFASTSFLYGVGLPEVPKKMLDVQDPHYQVIITAKATKETEL